jgi:NAD(P)-dependent dehydrogenase (short-subunit alcohol dehydrogenase family)
MSSTMKGKAVLITGATGGIGKETAKELAKLGATVVITGRNRERGEAAVEEIQQASGSYTTHLLLADLSSQADIRRLADTFKSQHERLDVLINNVGGLYNSRWETVDGIEATLAMNHVGPLLLTQLLLDVLKRSVPARVINVTGGMPTLKLDLDNLQAEKGFLGLQTYSHAKVAMMAASYEFARRLEGSGVSLNVAYPGAASTDMTRNMTPAMLPPIMRLLWPVFRLFMSNTKPAKAARSSVYLASSPEVEGVSRAFFNTNSRKTDWPKDILNASKRQQLWKISEALISSDVRAFPVAQSPMTIGETTVSSTRVQPSS